MAHHETTIANDHPAFQLAALTEADIEAKVGAKAYSGGRTHFRKGHIQSATLHGNVIEAICTGATIVPFEVQATLAKARDTGANPSNVFCTCSQTGYCQHVVALLLAWVDDPAQFEVRLDIDELLGEKSREELIDLIRRIVQRYPELEGFVELPLPLSPGDVPPAPANVATVRAEAIRRQLRSAFVGLEDDTQGPFGFFGSMWGFAAYNLEVLEAVTSLGDSYTAAAQWANVQVVFSALAEEVGHAMKTISDREGYLSEFLSKCDEALSRCLDAQAELPDDQRLPAEARTRLMRTIYDIWHEDIYVLGDVDVAWYGPAAIARAVTDDERATVEEWLRAEPHDGWGQHPRVDFIVTLREQAGLDDEGMLAIYRDAEMWGHVANVLLSRDRIDEAVAVASRSLTEPVELLGFADAMVGRGGDDAARALSMVDDLAWERGGANPLHDTIFQTWLASHYDAQGRPREALALAERRFRQQPSLQTFNAVRRAAELPGQEHDAWITRRPTLVDHLREQRVWPALVELSLEEEDAGAALDAFARWREQDASAGVDAIRHEDLVLRLALDAEQDFPDRAVELYHWLAEGRIERRQRSHYTMAAKYLASARHILQQHGRAAAWRDLIGNVRESHPTLRALHEELDNLNLE